MKITTNRKDDLLEDALNDPFFANLGSGLGKSYGLIFLTKTLGGMYTTDGKFIDKLTQDTSAGFRTIYLNGDKLYYVQKGKVYRWEGELVAPFGKNIVKSICKHNNELICTLKTNNSIVTLNGEVIYHGLDSPQTLAVFNGELYHTDRRGLVKTPHEVIKSTGAWSNGLASADKLYFGGRDRTIYSYDGENIEELLKTDFSIFTIHVVDDTLYAGGYKKKGLLAVPLESPKDNYTILEQKVQDVTTIISAPIRFIKGLKDGNRD